MKKRLLFIASILFLNFTLNAQTFEWANQIGGEEFDFALSIDTDNLGNIYTTGAFQDTVDFDPGAGVTNLISAGESDIFITKSDASGSLIWAKQMGGIGSDQGSSITVDPNGNIYVTGFFSLTADFDPGTGSFDLTSNGETDIFICKLDNAGDFVWANQHGGNGIDIGVSITVDANGNVYTTGEFEGTIDFDPGTGVENLISAGAKDIFISKLDVSGDFVWAKQLGNAADDFVKSIASDNNGNVYTTGYFEGTVDFDPGTSVNNLSSAGDYDIFISKLDGAGDFVWSKQFGGTDDDRAYSLAIDAGGNVYTTGLFVGTADFDPGNGIVNLTSAGGSDIYVSKLNALGDFVWAKQIESSDFDAGQSITVDANSNVYTTGYFQGTADFDPGASAFELTSDGGLDVFVSKLDDSGDFVWAKRFGGSLGDRSRSISVDPNQNLYTAGFFLGDVNFNTDGGSFELNSQGVDGFLHKMSQGSSVGLDDLSNNLIIYPNPAQDFLTISGVSNAKEIKIISADGKLVHSGSNTKVIDVSMLNQGLYFMQCTLENGQKITKKFIKQ
jgi:hypothetical protein